MFFLITNKIDFKNGFQEWIKCLLGHAEGGWSSAIKRISLESH